MAFSLGMLESEEKQPRPLRGLTPHVSILDESPFMRN